jgi:hypothetical protein
VALVGDLSLQMLVAVMGEGLRSDPTAKRGGRESSRLECHGAGLRGRLRGLRLRPTMHREWNHHPTLESQCHNFERV